MGVKSRARLGASASSSSRRGRPRPSPSNGASILHLNQHREFFAAIAAKTKRIEYRSQTPYWKKRLADRHHDTIHFRNGYATKAPEMLVKFRGLRRYGKGRNAYYAIRLGRILNLTRWRAR